MSPFDVVIVGASNAALTAALVARENGATVLILEKAPEHEKGGNSYFIAGENVAGHAIGNSSI